MAETNREVDTYYATLLNQYKNREFDFVDPEDHDRVVHMAQAYDENNVLVECPSGESTKSDNSMVAYLRHLKRYGQLLELTEATPIEYREIIQQLLNGTIEGVKDSGLSESTINVQVAAVRAFLRVHTDSVTEPDDLPDMETKPNTVDPEDMFTRDEIEALRTSCGNLRDKVIIDLLLYTGQRSTALRTLRIKDLDLDKGRFRLNTEAKGLKNADKNGKWRDLLLAEATVRQWLNTAHPEPDNPDAVVITALPSYNRVDPERPINSTTIGQVTTSVAEKAAEKEPKLAEKPTNPHAFRHNFVTIALRRGMEESAVKHQIGHSPSSSVMRTTYSHLQDSDYINQARQAFNKEVDETPNELVPTVCPKCGETPPETAKLCPWCGLEFTPGAKKTVEETEEKVNESYKQVEDMDQLEKVQLIDELLGEAMKDPELKAALIEQREE